MTAINRTSPPTTTKHSATCTMTFGRPRPETGCARCIELSQGAAPRRWARNSVELSRIAEIRTHNCAQRGCGPVCTFGDF